MLIRQSRYTPQTGWNPPLPVELDSEQTLLLIFAARAYGETANPLSDVLQSFPLGVQELRAH